MSDNTLPEHVAIICDGNRRWAREHKLEVLLGHRRAVDAVFEPLVDHAHARGVRYITFWIFSTENWQRDKREVEYLLDLFKEVFDVFVPKFHEKNVRVKTIGDISKFDSEIQERIQRGIDLTKDNTGITVIFAMNYGGRDELLRTVNSLVAAREASGVTTTTKPITKEEVEQALDTVGIPDPDFIIRTSGEHRSSGFLLWQSEYAELAFPKFYFPEFTPEKFDELLEEYASRKRRFGK
jgi:undecaprenyl diphosphate synthase